VGRYRFVDDRVLDGFDYNYVVTSVTQKKVFVQNTVQATFLESPFRAEYTGTVRPRIESGGGTMRSDGKVWVVPNPFKAHAPWEREPVPGDAFTRHIDFFGLPNAVARIRIYTLAGDLVQTIDHVFHMSARGFRVQMVRGPAIGGGAGHLQALTGIHADIAQNGPIPSGCVPAQVTVAANLGGHVDQIVGGLEGELWQTGGGEDSAGTIDAAVIQVVQLPCSVPAKRRGVAYEDRAVARVIGEPRGDDIEAGGVQQAEFTERPAWASRILA